MERKTSDLKKNVNSRDKEKDNHNNSSNNHNKNTKIDDERKEDNNPPPANEEGIIKASVTESNGEISCSIEETNRIRAMLGLKPLVVNKLSKEEEAVKNFKEQQK